jgi:Tfp pilus assembly protein PilE
MGSTRRSSPVVNPKGQDNMLSAEKRPTDPNEAGFAVIEMLIFGVLVLAILLAITVPAALAAHKTAGAPAARTNLGSALRGEESEWVTAHFFTSATTTLAGLEPSITWVDGSTSNQVDTTSPNSVLAVTSDHNDIVVLTTMGRDRRCWSVARVNDPNLIVGTAYTETSLNLNHACSSPRVAPTTFRHGSADGGKVGAWYTNL